MPKVQTRSKGKPAKKGGASLAATIKAELAKPVIPGQILFAAGAVSS